MGWQAIQGHIYTRKRDRESWGASIVDRVRMLRVGVKDPTDQVVLQPEAILTPCVARASPCQCTRRPVIRGQDSGRGGQGEEEGREGGGGA